MQALPNWFPQQPPLYDVTKSCAENATNGPFFIGEIPERPKTRGMHAKLFEFDLFSPIGIPAGPLFNAKWIALASKLGFDVLTYKTIRSFSHPGHQHPNILFVEPTSQNLAHTISAPDQLDRLTITNSFGMPSRSPDFLLEDIDRANRCLPKGQLLIVSVVGSTHQGISVRDDFVRAAQIARAAGAKVIEANFSCPNVGAEGLLYNHPEAVYDFARALVSAIHPIPLVLKMGLFSHRETMRASFLAAARAGARAICGINTVSMRIVDAQGLPALGPSRPTSGVCGAAIRADALQFLHDAHEILHKEKLDLTLIGCGGIVRAGQFDEFLSAGAQIAMSATGMMWDPLLALRYHWEKVHASPHPAAL
jgi:dihydroorotate dehydrogenase (NAD+) catalytic subunit